VKWIDELGAVPKCNPCATLKEDDIELRPDLAWISDTGRLGRELSSRLQWIRENRSQGPQFYVSLKPGVGNPDFTREMGYAGFSPLDSGFQLLALFRFWNIIQYWSPNRIAMGSDWDAVLKNSIPKLAFAKDTLSYRQELLALIAQVNDTHANLWGNLDARPPVGACRVPATLRFIEDEPVVTNCALTDLKRRCRHQRGWRACREVASRMDALLCGLQSGSAVARYFAYHDPRRLRQTGSAGCPARKRDVESDGSAREAHPRRHRPDS
jgi:hypothetical protein